MTTEAVEHLLDYAKERAKFWRQSSDVAYRLNLDEELDHCEVRRKTFELLADQCVEWMAAKAVAETKGARR